MMERLVARGEQIAREVEARRVERVADRLRDLLGDAMVSTFEAGVIANGNDYLLRWLNDPTLRFLRQALK